MTRVTSFLMPKRGQEASTFEEMQAGARRSDEQPKEAQPKEEPRAKVQTGNAAHQAKRRENQKKRKRENAAAAEKVDGEEAQQTNGWGKREDVMREYGLVLFGWLSYTLCTD